MIRDKIQTKEYFQENFEWYSKTLQRKITEFPDINPEYYEHHFRSMVINYEDLLRVGYSLGKDVQELFPYYQGILSNLKEVAFPFIVQLMSLPWAFFTVSARKSFWMI